MNPRDQPSLYVYYRISGANVIAARAAASRMHAIILGLGKTPPRVMQRPEADSEGRQTWMEVYEVWDASWSAIVDRALADSDLSALIEGPRHLELFIDLPCGKETGDAT